MTHVAEIGHDPAVTGRSGVAFRESTEGKPATIYDVARVAGVSHQTVSRLLRGYEGVRPATREKVEKALAALDYRRNIAAQNLRLGRTGMISLVIPSLNQQYFAELAQAVIVAGREVGVTVLVETTGGDRAQELSLLAGTREHLVDGVLFAPSTITPQDLDDRIDYFPLVLLGDRVRHSNYDHVVAANLEGAQAATKHLLSLGRTRIAAIGVEPPGSEGAAELRANGYKRALANANVPFDPALALDGRGWLRNDGVHAIKTALASGLRFDSVFGFNDALALGALRGLYDAGISVPEDVLVIGFDDTQDGRFSTPSLSTIAPKLDTIARTSIDMLMSAIHSGGRRVEHRELQAGFHLVARESTLGRARQAPG